MNRISFLVLLIFSGVFVGNFACFAQQSKADYSVNPEQNRPVFLDISQPAVADNRVFFNYDDLHFCSERMGYVLFTDYGVIDFDHHIDRYTEIQLRRAGFENMDIMYDFSSKEYTIYNRYNNDEYNIHTIPSVPRTFRITKEDIFFTTDMSWYMDELGRDFPIPMNVHNSTLLSVADTMDVYFTYITESGMLEMWQNRSFR